MKITSPAATASWWYEVPCRKVHVPALKCNCAPSSFSGTKTFVGLGCRDKAQREIDDRWRGSWVPPQASDWGVDDIYLHNIEREMATA